MHKTLLAIDGNSFVHRSFHALQSSGLSTRDGRPSWAVKGFLSQMLSVIDRIRPDALVVGFDARSGSVRKARWPEYKANRTPAPPELVSQLEGCVELLRSCGAAVIVPEGLEADDVLASAGKTATDAGWHAVLATSDRDSFALISETTSVLRLLNGGVAGSPILTPDRLETMYGIRPEQYRDYAAMRGDTSDNLAGVKGVGEKTAAKLLQAFGTGAAVFADAATGLHQRLAEVAGPAAVRKFRDPDNIAAFQRNSEVMAMRDDIDLGLDFDGGFGCLPLPDVRVTGAITEWELHSLTSLATDLLAGAPGGATTPASVPAPRRPSEPDPAGPALAIPSVIVKGAYGGTEVPRPARWVSHLL